MAAWSWIVKTTHLELIRHFDEFPNDMIIPDPVARIMLNFSDREWRRNRPVPRYELSARLGGSRVGDIRKLVQSALTPA
jgi:hypothetical protein